MNTHRRYIKRALDVASTSTYRWQLGALVVNNGNVLGWSTNRFRNRPDIDHMNATTHAEMAVLRECLLSVKGSDHLRCTGQPGR